MYRSFEDIDHKTKIKFNDVHCDEVLAFIYNIDVFHALSVYFSIAAFFIRSISVAPHFFELKTSVCVSTQTFAHSIFLHVFLLFIFLYIESDLTQRWNLKMLLGIS